MQALPESAVIRFHFDVFFNNLNARPSIAIRAYALAFLPFEKIVYK